MTEDGCRRDAAALVARVGCAAHFARLAREAGISVREFGAPPDAGLACSAAVLRRRRVVGRCCRRQGQGRGGAPSQRDGRGARNLHSRCRARIGRARRADAAAAAELRTAKHAAEEREAAAKAAALADGAAAEAEATRLLAALHAAEAAAAKQLSALRQHHNGQRSQR